MRTSEFEHQRKGRWLFRIGLLLLVAGAVVAAGAFPRYHRIVYGAPFAIAAFALLAAAMGRRSRPAAVACWTLAVAALIVWFRPSLAGSVPPRADVQRSHALLTLPADRTRTALFEELQPVEITNCTMERFGEANDGGYLLCANLLDGAASGYSYGIGPADKWGCDLSTKLNVPVHQYDCFDPGRPTCPTGRTVFHDACIGPDRRIEDGRIFDTLENQMAENGDGANRVIVKIDIEGAEWASLLATPPAVLDRIDQLVMEMHGVGLEQHLAVVRKLKEHFYVANVHFTNFACSRGWDPFPAWTYEVLFVNKRIAKAGGPKPWGPHALDAPNTLERPDCQAPVSRWSVIPGF